MMPSAHPEAGDGLTADLQAFLALCEECLAIVTRENQLLQRQNDYQSFEFYQKRKSLLPKLESALMILQKRRQNRLPGSPGHSEQTAALFQAIQNRVMKILLLDRENRQALLTRGLVPPAHLAPAAPQAPHFVAGLYRRHAGN